MISKAQGNPNQGYPEALRVGLGGKAQKQANFWSSLVLPILLLHTYLLVRRLSKRRIIESTYCLSFTLFPIIQDEDFDIKSQ